MRGFRLAIEQAKAPGLGLPAQVRKAHSIEEVLKAADFITLHVPLVNATRNLVNAHRKIALHPEEKGDGSGISRSPI